MKPITVLREEFIENIIEVCNDSGLPFFVVEDVLKQLIQETHIAAQKQLEEDKKKYQKELENK